MEPRTEPRDEDQIDSPAAPSSPPMMEAPGAATDASAQATESWNPAQGDRSFGYGTGTAGSAGSDASDPTDETTDSETEDADGEAGR